MRLGMLKLTALVGCLGLAACLPKTHYVPKPGKVALAMKSGRLAMIKNGIVAERDEFSVALRCDPRAASKARVSETNFASARRNESTSGVFSALTPIFPLAPLIGLPFAIKANNQNQRAGAAMVDAMNIHNAVPVCTNQRGPGSVIGAYK